MPISQILWHSQAEEVPKLFIYVVRWVVRFAAPMHGGDPVVMAKVLHP